MQFTYIIPTLLSLASAQSIFESWKAAGTNDVRGPCPGLNSLANHGILPHDGKNITVANIVSALAALNISTEVATILGMTALKTSTNPASGTFTLENLKVHNLLEHDGSLTRKDDANDTATTLAEKQKFDQATYNEYVSYFNGSADISIAMLAKARWGRMQTSRKENPTFVYGASQRFNSYAETTVAYVILGNPTTQTIPFNYLKTFLTEERLPYTEGWRVGAAANGLTVGNIMMQLALNTPEDPIKDLVPAKA